MTPATIPAMAAPTASWDDPFEAEVGSESGASSYDPSDAVEKAATPLDAAAASEVVKRAGRFEELGTTGLKQTGGFLHEEFLRQLAGQKGMRVYREMGDNDPVVGGLLFAIDMLFRQVEWRVEPAEAASVEEIMAKRQEERARAIASAQEAEKQRQEQASAAAQGLAGKGGPGMPGKDGPSSKAPSPDAVKKALDHFGISMSVEEWMQRTYIDRRLDHLPRNRPFRKEKNAGDPGAGGEDPQRSPKKNARGEPSRRPATSEEFLAADPATLAEIEGEETAIFVETCTMDMDTGWDDAISEIATMLRYGFHVGEIVYKRRGGIGTNPRTSSRFDDGKIGWRKWGPRAQDTIFRWDFDEKDGSVRGCFQHDPAVANGMVYIPFEKMLLFRTQAHRGNPEGRSILRNAYRPWYFKKRIEEIEAIGIERDLAGLPVARVPWHMLTTAATTEEQQAVEEIKKIVRNIKRDEQEGLLFPRMLDPESGTDLFDLELLSTGGQRQFDTDKIVARYDQRIVMTVLADFILLGHEAVGSKALGTTKVDLFTAALEAWLDAIAQVVNTYAIPRLLRVNGMDPALSPKLVHGRLSQVDLAGLGDFIQKISAAGAPLFPDERLEGHLRDVASLPPKEGTEEL